MLLLASASGGTSAWGIPSWPSGAYLGAGGNPAVAYQFANYRGRELSVVNVYPERSTWEELRADKWEVKQFDKFPGRLSIAVPLMPTDEPTTLQAIADGSHDSDFTQLANNLVALKRGNSDIRLGWEFNGDWYGWSARDPKAFIAAYRRIALIFRRASPAFTLNWNGNAVESMCGHNPFVELYPGDDVVDVIGVDAYDWAGTEVTDSESFSRWLNLDQGLNAWLTFARKHHKPFAVSEWGLVGGANPISGEKGEGDNPAFITGMYEFFRQNQSDLAYESYFNQPIGLANSLTSPVQLPASSEIYSTLWKMGSAES